ncbi:hypothetical protein T265_14379, partial [Opisthorchis viverrini]
MMHCNVNPGAVLLAGEGKWKLGGLNFMEKVIDTTKASPKFTGYSAKFPKAAQPNLDFIAPEAQMHNSMSPLADMFSLGMVLCAIYNEGHSLIESDFNPTVYAKRISELKIFNEPTVLSYEGLLSLESRSINQKKEFFNRFAKVVPEYDPVLRYKRILPLLLNWYEKSTELSPFVLPSLLTMIHVAENDDFEAYLREPLMKIMTQRKTLQLKLCVLECIERLLPSLSSPGVAQEIVAFLSTVRTTDSSMLSCILAINRHLLSERKFGITCSTIAGKLLPPLLDALTSPLLGLNDFRLLMDVLRFMLDTIDRQRTCELILRERKSQGGSCSNISSSYYLLRKRNMCYITHFQFFSLSCFYSTPTGLGRNLPLISMQKPTVDADFMGSDIDDARFSRTSLS